LIVSNHSVDASNTIFFAGLRAIANKFPTNENELVGFWKKSVDFMEARLKRIGKYAKRNYLLNLSDKRDEL